MTTYPLALWDCCSLTWLGVAIVVAMVGAFLLFGGIWCYDKSAEMGEAIGAGGIMFAAGIGLTLAWLAVRFL